MDRSDPTARDERFMAEAIELARRAAGRTHPNPLVGCVITRGDLVVGRGWHRQAGCDHGEVDAIKDADADLQGCELFVNHEPCCHFGRTPPCTNAIVEAGIRRVVVGTIDPDPRVSGKGLDILRDAGVEVVCGVLEEESRKLNAPFFTYINKGRPLVAAKWAMSLDGKIATHNGDSAWITGEAARRHVHHLRDIHDAILVGANTLHRDDPRLTCRLDEGRDPVRFVLDERLEAPATHRIFQPDLSTAPTVVLTGPAVDEERKKRLLDQGVEVVSLELDERGWLSTQAILSAVYDRQLMSVLVEGGGALLGSLFDAQAVDYAYAYIAPRLIGGSTAPTPLQGRGVEAVARGLLIAEPTIEQFPPDLLIHGEVAPRPAATTPA